MGAALSSDLFPEEFLTKFVHTHWARRANEFWGLRLGSSGENITVRAALAAA